MSCPGDRCRRSTSSRVSYAQTRSPAGSVNSNFELSLHGGGGAPARVNDRQWENQVKLYQPPDSLYVVPRAPTGR